jgi:hypothetical protein
MKTNLLKRLWLLLIILLVMTLSVNKVFADVKITVKKDGTISNLQTETSQEESLSVSGWHGKKGMTLVEDESEITVSGLQDGLGAFAAVGLGGKKIEPGKNYVFEASMKVEELSPPTGGGPSFVVAVKNEQDNAYKYHQSNKYVITNIGQWQKLSVAFSGDEDESFSYINLQKGSKQAISAKIFLKDISLTIKDTGEVSLAATTTPMGEEKVDYVTIPAPEKTFNKSDVFGYGRNSVDIYKEYNIDFVPWGGTFYPQHIDYYQKHIMDAQKVGTVISAKVSGRTNWKGFIDFAGDQALDARLYNISNNPILLPFRSEQTHKGLSSYYFDANHEFFINFLKNNIDHAMSYGADGLFVDDPLGTASAVIGSRGAGYGKRNSDIFKNYLQSRFSQSQLAQMGIGDIESFSLKDFHGGYSLLEPNKRPLYDLISDCFLHESLNTFREISDYARNKSTKTIAVGANTSLPNKRIPQIFFELDYTAPETKMGASSGKLDNSENRSLFTFKNTESLRRPVAIMGSGHDHDYIKKNDLPGMVRGWIAEAYAHGNYFLAPHKLWAIDSDGDGTHHYEPSDHKMFSSLYAFIKDHSELFDGYECAAKVGLVSSFEDYQNDSSPAEKLTYELSRENVDLDLLFAGNDALPIKIDKNRLKQYNYVVLPPNSSLSEVDQKTIQQYAQTGKVIKSINEIGNEVKIDLPGENMVRATMRKHSSDKKKPYVLHLLNRDYDMSADSCRVKKNFKINIPDSLVEYGKITKVVFHQPLSLQDKKTAQGARSYSDNPTKEINYSHWNNGVTLSIPELDLWGLVVIYANP